MNKLAEELELYRNPQLDEACKNLFKYKPILARILKECVPEYEYSTISEIESYIQETEKNVPLFRGQSLDKIAGLNTESGRRSFDIRFNALSPDGDGYNKILLDLEVQNRYSTGYSLVTRGIFYGARMISDQDGVEFESQNYGQLKKVYSIWIATDPAESVRNCINRYKMEEEQVIGEMVLERQDYDKIAVVLINLGEKAQGGILRMLEVLLSKERSLESRKEILEQEFMIPMNSQMKEGLEEMCNYSTGVYLDGHTKGSQGARVESILNVMSSLSCDIQKAMDILKIPVEEQETYRKLVQGK
ncbi:MAG: hypothetical protein IJ315_05725 [Firmicutes bacterium]|nr:hypothetical protein [Bacillota bacterium]